MKDKQKLIMDLRDEYLALMEKIAKAKFAVETLDFDETPQELLVEQIDYMSKYAEILLARASYERFDRIPSNSTPSKDMTKEK